MCTTPGLRRSSLFHCVKALSRDDRCPCSLGCRESVAFSRAGVLAPLPFRRTAAVCPAPVEGASVQGGVRMRIEAREEDIIKEASYVVSLPLSVLSLHTGADVSLASWLKT
ncbi:hypothetical protein K523DRAFT_422038 [Schizophyllum commune Tattone D]|nr:hypothetical protein K523DRAFT_422038 [Schizophyllum commune Tattone D]